MPRKSAVLNTGIVLTTIVVAALTSIGAEFGKTWLPEFGSYIWNKVTKSEVVYVTVSRDESHNPIRNAVISVFDQNPERKTQLDSTTTDSDGRAVLRNVKLRHFFLRVTYSEGGEIYTFRANYDIDVYPYRIEIADKTKWVRASIQTSSTSVVPSTPSSARVPIATLPNWLQIALGELGVKELPPPQSNPRIEEYHASTSLGRASQDVPWACSFVSWVLEQSHVPGNLKSARCADYLNFGISISEPKQGAITILGSTGIPEARSGQAGFLLKADAETVTVVAGNVDNQVAIVNYPRNRVRGFRWPSGTP